MKTQRMIFASIFIAMMIGACKKDSADPQARLNIRMTDAPADYTEVNVDLRAIEVTGPDEEPVTLNVNAGVYNLLDLSNGTDTLIATGTLNAGKVSQIRLILGANNSVKAGGVRYPLSTPSAMQSGLKLQVHQELKPGVEYSILLDFDANQSVVSQGNGNYSLKPVIRTINTAISGAIKGKISEAEFATVFAVSASNDTYTTMTNANGEFLLRGLPPGTYTVTIDPADPFSVTTIGNVSVTIGNTTQLGIINI